MKWGIIISVAMAVIFGVVITVSMVGIADSPTSATSASRLQKVSLPADLPAVGPKGSGDANAAYKQALNFFVKNREALISDPPDLKLRKKLSDLLTDAMKKGEPTAPFLDDLLPMGVLDCSQSEYIEALQYIPGLVIGHAYDLNEAKKSKPAYEASLAVFMFGKHMFDKSTRLDLRFTGLHAMLEGGKPVIGLADEGDATADAVSKHLAALEAVKGKWEDKMQIVRAPKPHVGDLINIAQNDGDKTFRIAATRWLGMAKFYPRTRGNERVIASAIAAAKASSDSMIQAAGDAAESFTASEHKRMR